MLKSLIHVLGANVYTMSPGRVGAIVAIGVGLIGAVLGVMALTRSANRRRATVALTLGSIGLVLGGVVVMSADGGLGTGHGFGGGVVAIVVALIGIALNGLALTRARRAE